MVSYRRRRSWPVWPLPFAVPRPVLTDSLLRSIGPVGRDEPSGLVAVVGPGGSGRTTVVREVCGRPEVQRRHSEGLLWLSLGAATTGPALAARIDEAVAAVTGSRMGTSDPERAAAALVAAAGKRLIVVDEVWHPTHAALCRPPIGAPRWLVVTRDESLLPADSTVIRTVPFRLAEARALLAGDTLGVSPGVAAELVGLTGGWPLPLVVAGRAFFHCYQRTFDKDDVIRRIEHAGGDVLAVALELLSPPARARCLELAIFPPDQDVPLSLLSALWATTAATTERTCMELADAMLVEHTAGTVRVPEPIHAWLGERLGAAGARVAHGRLADTVRVGPEWTLPTAVTEGLAGHLAGAAREVELASLVTDPRWVSRRLRDGGSAAIMADLAASSAADGALARRLRVDEVLYANLELPEAMAVALADRLEDGELLRPELPVPHLAARWPLPDAQPALRQRVVVQEVEASQIHVVMAPDGSWFADHGNACAGWVTIIDLATGRRLASLESGHAWAVDVTADGRWLVTVPGEYPARLWDTRTWTLAHELPLAQGGDTAESVTFAGDGTWLAIGHGSGAVSIWDTASGAMRRTLAAHDDRVLAVAAMADGAGLVTSSVDGSVRLWEPDTGTLRHTWPGHNVKPRVAPALAVAPDGSWLATGDATAVRIWDTRSGAPRHTFDTAAWQLVAAPDGSWLAAAGPAGTVRIWDTATGCSRHVLPVHPLGTKTLVVAPDGSWLAAVSKGDNLVWIWDTRTGERRATLSPEGNMVCSLAVAPDGSRLVTGGFSGVARIWDPRVPQWPDATPEHAASVNQLVTTESWLATAGGGVVRVLDAETGAPRHVLTSHPSPALATAAGWLATGQNNDGAVKTWDPTTGSPLRTLGELGSPLRKLIAAPDGSWLAAASDRTVRIWDPATGAHRLDLQAGAPIAAAPDGSWLAAAEEATVVLWDPLTGTRLHTLPAADPTTHQATQSIVVAPDGSWLATLPSILGGRVLRIWSPTTGALLHSLNCPDGVGAATDEQLITAGGATLRIWDVATGTLRHTVTGRNGGTIQAVAATTTLVATTVNHTRHDHQWGAIHVHAIDTGDLLTTAMVYGSLNGCQWTSTGLHAHGSAGLYAFSWIT